MAPVPVLFAFLLSLVLVMSGTVYSSWRAATVAPIEAMR
jgi:ABC-type lipoprotein release transport system permease subunit